MLLASYVPSYTIVLVIVTDAKQESLYCPQLRTLALEKALYITSIIFIGELRSIYIRTYIPD